MDTIAQLWREGLESFLDSEGRDPKVKQAEELMYQCYKDLKDLLGEQEQKLFEKYDDAAGNYALAFAEKAFCDGFSLGTKLTTEALSGAEK